MAIVVAGITKIWVSRTHHFGDQRRPKFLKIQLLFWTIFILDKKSQQEWISNLKLFLYEGDFEQVKSVRIARKKGYKRGIAEAKKDNQDELKRWEDAYNMRNEENKKLNTENYTLRKTIEGLRIIEGKKDE